MTLLKQFVIICFILALAHTAFGAWEINEVGVGGGIFYDVTVTAGRNGSTTPYVYAACSDSRVYEFAWNGASWVGGPIASDYLRFQGITAGQGRNDGTMYVYATNVDDRIHELYYNGASWIRTELPEAGDNFAYCAVGPGRNNESTVYVYGGEDGGVVHEYEYNGSWTRTAIGGPGGFNNFCHGLAMGKGRNDGIQRLYAGFLNGHVWEYTWNGAGWSSNSIGRSAARQVRNIVVGQVRSSEYSVFVASDSSRIYEYFYVTDTPTPTATATTSSTESATPTQTLSYTPTATATPTFTQTLTRTQSVTRTHSATITETLTISPTATISFTPTATYTITPTFTFTATATITQTRTQSATSTATTTFTATPSITITPTISVTSTVSATYTATPTLTIIPSETVTSTGTISCTVTSTPTDNISASNLNNVITYPNPYRTDTNTRGAMIFFNLPAKVVIRLYSLDGCLVRTIEKDDSGNRASWDLKNKQGKPVASGLYIYIIKTDVGTRRGKVVIVR
ncbi:T9SS type A sorting domain-containing protein [bacterium]|nr:T9SS type A sorting domain-containing protein [bacterium]